MNKTTEKDAGRMAAVRIRLSPERVKEFEVLRQFLGMRSLSATVARVAFWNVRILSRALEVDTNAGRTAGEDFAKAVGPMVEDFAKAIVRKAMVAQAEKDG